MAGNKKPRKAHRPKPAQLPVAYRFSSDDERTLQLIPHQELERLRTGEADESCWHTITCRLNIGMTLARRLYSADAVVTMAHALDAVCDVRDRFKRVAKWGLSGDEAKRIGAGLVLTDEMQKASTRRQMRDAINYVMKAAAHGN